MKLLLVEDNDLDARDVVELVSAGCSEGMTVQHVHTCAGALAALKSPEEFDVILLDLTLPDSRGEETVARLMGQNPSTPCVVLSGTDNLEVAVKALRLGAQDYLVKAQLDVALLHRAIRYAIERKRIERRLEFLAGYDQLTGLVNRFRLHDIAEHALVNAGRQRTLAALLYFLAWTGRNDFQTFYEQQQRI